MPSNALPNVAPSCRGGFYSAPPVASANTRIRYNSASISSDSLSRFTGNVSVLGDQLNAEADLIDYSATEQWLNLIGNATVRIPGLALSASDVRYSLNSNNASVNSGVFVIHDSDLYGRAEQFNRNGPITVAADVWFTRCAPSDNAWALTAQELTIDTERNVGQAWHTTLRVQNIPVFYLPYVSFPLNDQRHTGFLTPTFGFSTKSPYLTRLVLPFYWNIAPNLDDTLTLDYSAANGALLRNEFRFLTRQHSGINRLDGLIARPENDNDTDSLATEESPQRWALNHQQSGQITDQLGYRLSATTYSDITFDQTFNNAKDLVNEQKLSASLQHRQGDLGNTLELDYFQPIVDSSDSFKFQRLNTKLSSQYNDWQVSWFQENHQPYDEIGKPITATDYKLKRVPEITIKHKTQGPWGILSQETVQFSTFSYALRQQDVDSLTETTVNRADQYQRNALEWQLTRPFNASYGYFRPSLTAYATDYRTQNDELARFPNSTRPDHARNLLYTATLDQGLLLVNEGATFRQTLEPRIHYTFTPFVEQDNPFLNTTLKSKPDALFETQRFDGRDRIGDSQRISMSLSSDLSDAAGKQRYLRTSALKGIKLSQERITLQSEAAEIDPEWKPTWSTWQLNALWTPKPQWRLNVQTEFEHDDFALSGYQVNARYQPETRVFANISADWTDDTHTYALASYLPVRHNVALFGYISAANDTPDLQSEAWQVEEYAYGVEYESCCWNVRLAALDRRLEADENTALFPLETERSLFFEVGLKGIGANFGTIEQFLRDLDVGYSGRVFNYR